MEASHEVRLEALKTIRTWWAAWVRGDTATVARLTHSCFDEFGDKHRFRRLGVARLLSEVASCPSHCRIDRWEVIPYSVASWRSVVVCHYAFRIHGARGSKFFDVGGKATDVLVRGSDGLQLFSHQGEILGKVQERFAREGSSPPTTASWGEEAPREIEGADDTAAGKLGML